MKLDTIISRCLSFSYRGITLVGVFIAIIFLASSCSNNNQDKPNLNIAVAANMQFAMDSISKIYEKNYGVSLNLSCNSSGMLTNQILEGAPFDVFVSANMKYPRKLIESEYAKEVTIYAHGQLVLVYTGDKVFNTIKEVLYANEIQTIGVANKVTAPYGIASIEFIENMNWPEINSKIVYGESVGQVNQYLETSSVDAAFTSN